jgi:site-specific DNA recombinase
MPASLAGILAPGTDVAQWWDDAPVSARREVARIILSPGLLGEVRVKRAVRSGNAYTPAAERIIWHRRKHDRAEG